MGNGVKTDFDFLTLQAVLKDAGLTIAEAAGLFRVSRPTMYHWGNGNPPNQSIILSNALRIISAIQRATAAKALPIPADNPETKVKEVAKVLRQYLTA